MDARVLRTRARLQEALLALAREKPASEVTVSDVAERAGVNRSTFYQHYTDTDTLLADALDAAAERAASELRHEDLDPDQPPAMLAEFLAHIADNVDIYRQALVGNASGAVIVSLRARVGTMIRESAPEEGWDTDLVPIDVMSAGVAGNVLGVITAWLEREPLAPPVTAARWAWASLFGPGRSLSPRHTGETPER